jgi:hypothetical protein
MASKLIEDVISSHLGVPIHHPPGMVQYMEIRSLLSSAAIELRSLRELCKQQRKRLNQMEGNDDKRTG